MPPRSAKRVVGGRRSFFTVALADLDDVDLTRLLGAGVEEDGVDDLTPFVASEVLVLRFSVSAVGCSDCKTDALVEATGVSTAEVWSSETSGVVALGD